MYLNSLAVIKMLVKCREVLFCFFFLKEKTQKVFVST